MDLRTSDVPLRTRRRALVAVVAGAAVVLALAAGVLLDVDPQIRLDGAASRALYAGDDRSAGLDAFLSVLTAPGVTWARAALLVPLALWLLRRGTPRPLVWVVPALLLVGVVTAGLKELVGRARPAFEDGGLGYGSLSYPSGHSSGIAALVTVGLVLAWPRLRAAARPAAVVAGVALAVLVGLTRLWLGVHFPSDVVGGWALGVAWTLGLGLVLGGLPGGTAALPAREERP